MTEAIIEEEIMEVFMSTITKTQIVDIEKIEGVMGTHLIMFNITTEVIINIIINIIVELIIIKETIVTNQEEEEVERLQKNEKKKNLKKR